MPSKKSKNKQSRTGIGPKPRDFPEKYNSQYPEKGSNRFIYRQHYDICFTLWRIPDLFPDPDGEKLQRHSLDNRNNFIGNVGNYCCHILPNSVNCLTVFQASIC